MRITHSLWPSVRECLKILKIWQTTNFDMGFHKNDMTNQFFELHFNVEEHTAFIEPTF
jgi:hypothetical protein